MPTRMRNRVKRKKCAFDFPPTRPTVVAAQLVTATLTASCCFVGRPPALKKTPIEAPAESSSHGPHEAEASGGVGKAEEGGSGAAGNSGNKASSGSNPPTDQSSDENDWAVVGEAMRHPRHALAASSPAV